MMAFVSFHIIFTYRYFEVNSYGFQPNPTQQNWVNRKHPTKHFCLIWQASQPSCQRTSTIASFVLTINHYIVCVYNQPLHRLCLQSTIASFVLTINHCIVCVYNQPLHQDRFRQTYLQAMGLVAHRTKLSVPCAFFFLLKISLWGEAYWLSLGLSFQLWLQLQLQFQLQAQVRSLR